MPFPAMSGKEYPPEKGLPHPNGSALGRDQLHLKTGKKSMTIFTRSSTRQILTPKNGRSKPRKWVQNTSFLQRSTTMDLRYGLPNTQITTSPNLLTKKTSSKK